MFHRKLSRRHQHLMLATALVAAWMWSVPLFDGLQSVLPVEQVTGIPFRFLFLVGSVCGYLPLALLQPTGHRSRLAVASPIASLILMLFLFASGRLLPDLGVHLHLGLAVAMGACTAPLFAAWGASIAWVRAEHRGRYVGEMLLAASAAHVIILALIRVYPPAALVAVTLMIGASGLLLRTASPAEADFVLPAAENSDTDPDETKVGWATSLFWLVFFLLLVSYYSLSWTGHELIMSEAVEGPILALLGPALYGLVALYGGIVVDRTEELETAAMLGLALLISCYLVAPLAGALEMWVPVNLIMEASYGVLDLFVFVCIAAAAGMLGKSPYQYYALGLALNAAVVASGFTWMEQMGAGQLDPPHSVVMAVALIIGTSSIAVLRGLRGHLQAAREREEPASDPIGDGFSTEELTPRQKEVVALMLQGHDNATIAAKLHITANTLKTHIRNIYGKAQVTSRAQLILKINRWSEQQAKEEVVHRLKDE